MKYVALVVVAVIVLYFLVKWLARQYFRIIFYGELEP